MATPVSYLQDVETFRVFVATWNVGGKSPHSGLNLDDFLRVHDQSDIYVLGFQEIVPLNAGNVLVMEDNGPAAKWLSLISQSLNRSPNNINKTTSSTYDAANHSALRSLKLTTTSTAGGSLFFQRTSSSSLRTASKIFRVEKARRLESCNCRTAELESRKYSKDSCFKCQPSNISSDDQEDEDDFSAEDDDDDGDGDGDGPPPHSFMFSDHHEFSTLRMKKYYSLIASKQMVGIFVSVWVRKELVQHISHLRISCVSRGRIMGCLRNKGCISVSMSFHRTSFCFVCSHLASGEKEGDELRRNSDFIEILKNTQFPSISKTPNCSRPEKILEHDRVIWLGDLNYRIALSYTETRKLLEENNWDALLEKDQLKIEREADRVFKGWKEGKIYFAPTYKYYYNSDTYAGGTSNSKSKRRTPAWCDRILWHGNGIRQLSYVRGESRFSDHRPVCATFIVDVVRGYY